MIIQLQEKKSAMVDATLSTDDSVSRFTGIAIHGIYDISQAMGRLTPEDVSILPAEMLIISINCSFLLRSSVFCSE